MVFGLAGRFWRWDGDLRPISDRAAFLAFAEPGCVKAAWNLAASDAEETSCVLSTETRITYFGDTPRRRFRLYWSLIKPFSGAQRRAMLAGVARAAEAPVSRT